MSSIRDLELNSEALIVNITGSRVGKNFELYKSYVMTSLMYPSYLDVNRHKVTRAIEGLHDKFFIHSQHRKAEQFFSLCQKLLQNPIFKKDGVTDVPFAILALLFELADHPTGAEYDPDSPTTTEKPDPFEDLLREESLHSPHEESEFSSSSASDLSVWSDDDGSDVVENVNKYEDVHRSVPVSKISGIDVCMRSSDVQRALADSTIAHRSTVSGVMGRSWLHDHLQLPYWNRVCQSTTKRSPSQRSARHLCTKWNNCISEASAYWAFGDMTELSERQIVREILWMLGGSRDGRVFMFDAENHCAINLKVKLSHVTRDALFEWLSPLTGYASTLQKLRNFIRDVANGFGDSTATQTYEAYAASLSEWLCDLKSEVSTLEHRFVSESDTPTLTTLIERLEPWFRKLALLEGLHRSGVESCPPDWPPWAKATHLLNVLYVSAVDVDSSAAAYEEEVILIVSIIMKSMRPYLSIMGSWMSVSGLQDPRAEFIVACNEEVSTTDETFWDRVVFVRNISSECGQPHSLTPKFLEPVLPTFVVIAKSVEILRRLGRLADVQQCGSCETLYSSVVKNFGELAETYDSEASRTHESNGCPATSKRRRRYGSEREDSGGHFRAFLNYVESDEMFDPILSWYFKSEYLEESDFTPSCVNAMATENAFVERSVRSFVRHVRGHLSNLLQRALVSVVMRNGTDICEKFFQVLADEFHFKTYLMNFRKYFLMEAGDVIYKFYSRLFNTIPGVDLVARELDVDLLLQVIVSGTNPGDAADLKISVDTTTARSGQLDPINSYDCLCLSYRVPWPLNLVIDSSCQKKYGEVFTFLLQIKRAHHAVVSLHFSELNSVNEHTLASQERQRLVTDREKRRRLAYLFRMKLLHFVHCLHDYLMIHILRHTESLCVDLCERSGDFQDLVNRHRLYLKIVYERCLLHRPVAPIKKAISKILNLALVLHDLWKSGIDCITLEDITKLEADLKVCCTFIKRLCKTWMADRSLPYLQSLIATCCHAVDLPRRGTMADRTTGLWGDEIRS